FGGNDIARHHLGDARRLDAFVFVFAREHLARRVIHQQPRLGRDLRRRGHRQRITQGGRRGGRLRSGRLREREAEDGRGDGRDGDGGEGTGFHQGDGSGKRVRTANRGF